MTSSLNLIAQQATRWLFLLLLFAVPFSKAAIEILFPILLIAWIIGWDVVRKSSGSVHRSPILRPIVCALLAYLAVCIASIFTSSNPGLSLRGFTRKTLEYALLFLIASDVARHPTMARGSLRALMGAGWLVVAWAFLQEWGIFKATYKSTVVDPIRGFPLHYVRMSGPYENPNDLATFLMVTGLILLAFLIARGRWAGVGKWILGLLLLVCLAWTQSLGALAGFAVGLLPLFILYGRTTKRIWAIGAFSLMAVTGFLFAREGHLGQVLSFTDAGSQERMVMWHTGWRMFMAHPWAGVGLNTFMFNYGSYAGDPNGWPAYAHNCFLQVAAETGIFGLIFFLVFVLYLFSVCWRSLTPNIVCQESTAVPFLAGVVAGLSAFLVQSAFDTNFYALRQAALFWTLAGVALGTAVGFLQRSASPHAGS